MLVDLRIRNFAIIDELEVGFGAGLNVLTGETGAGKSIIIDALSLVLGRRASAEAIRAGTEEASVEAVFELARQPALKEALAARGLEAEEELIIRRQIARNGRSRVFINGRQTPLQLLQQLSSALVDIYGQQDHYELLDEARHLTYLDAFGLPEEVAASYRETYRRYAEARERYAELQAKTRAREERIDLLSFQTREISAAALQPEEDMKLASEKSLLANAAKLKELAQEADELLSAQEPSALTLLARALRNLKEIARLYTPAEPLAARMDPLLIELDDLAKELAAVSRRWEADPARLVWVDDRLEAMKKLKRKYGATLEEVLNYQRQAEAELELLSGLEEEISVAAREAEEQLKKVRAAAEELSRKRRAAGARLEEDVEKELQELSLPGARFKVAFAELAPERLPDEKGLDEVHFQFSANPGEPLLPLAKVASGGELSRVMLALKKAMAISRVPTVIFDEVDSGIGGRVAEVLGRKLKEAAAHAQVLCITHLPQVASFADTHFQVEKKEENQRVVTRLKRLSAAEREMEIARMLGGITITDKTRAHAREMLRLAAPTK